jgi:hypothetical protein
VLGGKTADFTRPEDAEWPVWACYLRDAWQDLRDDRRMGDMGGMGRIYFAAIDQYASRYDIAGAAFDDFLRFIRVLDDEFMRHTGEKRKAEAELKTRGQR